MECTVVHRSSNCAQTMLCIPRSMNVTRRIISLPSRQTANSLQCLSDSSRPFSLTRSYFNLHTFSSTTMNSIPRSTTRLGLWPLGHYNSFRAPLLKRSSQIYARPTSVGAPHLSRFDVADNSTLTRCPQPRREFS